MMADLNRVQRQILILEQAMPQEKMTWRPGEGVRSVSEVYLHIAFANYVIGKASGIEPPAGLDLDEKNAAKWEASTTDKEKVAAELKKSFDYLKTGMLSFKEADMDRKIPVWGTQLTIRAILLIAVTHHHEHLGQAIAYARINGVVPPWTAAQQQKSKEASEPKK